MTNICSLLLLYEYVMDLFPCLICLSLLSLKEPHMEVISPGSKGVQTYIMNRLLVYMYREFRAIEKRGSRPFIRADELSAQFPSLSEAFLRKRLKHCADLQVLLGNIIQFLSEFFSTDISGK